MKPRSRTSTSLGSWLLIGWIAALLAAEGGCDEIEVSPGRGAEASEEGYGSASEAGIWSLAPLRPPVLPNVRGGAWARTPIDLFILAKLEEQGMSPSGPASKATVLRRLRFALTGIPPTPEEVETFLADARPDAVGRKVEQLLASPQYGERWARHWLDLAHYADSHGHDQDRPRTNAWPYRDYVIQSLNSDKPYARFVEEQLAGDWLYPGDPQAIIATGFIAAGPWDESSQMHIMADTVDKKIAQHLDRDDMVATAMSTFVSATVHCARCHDHKFDPISQDDYYSLQAVFAGVDRVDRPFNLPPETSRLRNRLTEKKAALESRQPEKVFAALDAAEKARIKEGQRAWEERTNQPSAEWVTLMPEEAVSAQGASLMAREDGSVISAGARPERDSYVIRVRTRLRGITAFRLEVFADASLPSRGPGRQDNGNFHLSEFRAAKGGAEQGGQFTGIRLVNPSADFNQQGWGIGQAIDGNTATAWGIYPEVGKDHLAIFETAEDLGGAEEETPLEFTLDQQHGGGHLIGKFRLSATSAPRPVSAQPLPPALAKALRVPAEERDKAALGELEAFYLKISPELTALIEGAARELESMPAPEFVYAAANDFAPAGKFTPAKTPREIRVLRRGDVTRPGALAAPGALSCLPGLEARFRLEDPRDEGARRAALAKWISDPRNVLTWRSIVNRVWHYHFGRGLADTPSDFGRMGSRPTHPELLDWLAGWFVEQGGSLKKLHYLILTSAVYLQSTQHDPDHAAKDSGNSFLWRMNRMRLDAESLRDSILTLSGKVDWRMGGPSVKQFHFEDPNPGVTPKVDYNRFEADDPANFRRSVYRFIFRTLPDPFMDSLDCADASQLTPARNISITAIQALAMMNNPFVVRQSEHFAARLESMHGGLEEQIRCGFEMALGREPRAEEAEGLKAYGAAHGLANVCRILLNSNEFLFVN